MRDMLEDAFKNNPLDATESARQAARPQLRRRFYKAASVGEGPDGHVVRLDGRPVRTPKRNPLALPTKALAEAVAAEWDAQSETVDPARMPLTRLANTIIDGVVSAEGPVADEIAKYLGSDLLFYRADQPVRLVSRQAQVWDPVLAWAHEVLGARFILAEGVVFVEQPPPALANARQAIPQDAWRLGALHVITTLTGSALLALAILNNRLSVDEAWAAAHVDEDWNMEAWGRDELALQRRAFRFAEMQVAARVLNAL